MQTISVRNFGPVKNIELDIKEMTIMIGEQASGKSTVAKLVYYFRKIKNYFAIMMKKRTGIIWNQMYPVFAYRSFKSIQSVHCAGWRKNILACENDDKGSL